MSERERPKLSSCFSALQRPGTTSRGRNVLQAGPDISRSACCPSPALGRPVDLLAFNIALQRAGPLTGRQPRNRVRLAASTAPSLVAQSLVLLLPYEEQHLACSLPSPMGSRPGVSSASLLQQLPCMILSAEQCPLKASLVCCKILEAQSFWPGLKPGF